MIHAVNYGQQDDKYSPHALSVQCKVLGKQKEEATREWMDKNNNDD